MPTEPNKPPKQSAKPQKKTDATTEKPAAKIKKKPAGGINPG